MSSKDWPPDKWLPWRKQPFENYVKGPYLTNRKDRKRQAWETWKANLKKPVTSDSPQLQRVKHHPTALVAQMRYIRGYGLYAFLRKPIMRKLGLDKKTLTQYTTVDFVRVGAQPSSSFTGITSA